MKNFLSRFPKRDLIFISLILIILLVLIVSDTSVDILVNYDEEMLRVTSPRLNMDIPNADVESLTLVDMPEPGVLVDGYKHEAYCTGVWENDRWGEYDLCVIPTNAQCIVVTLSNGRTMVFSCTTDAKTVELFESYRTYLNK